MIEIEPIADKINGFYQQLIEVERSADVACDISGSFELKRAGAAFINNAGIVNKGCSLVRERNKEIQILIVEGAFVFEVLDDHCADWLILNDHGRSHP